MRKIFILIGVVVAIGGAIGIYAYHVLYGRNVQTKGDTATIYIPSNSTYMQVRDSLAQYLVNETTFQWVARQMDYAELIKPGKYQIADGWSNYQLVSHLRSGHQTPVNLVVSTGRDVEQVVARITRQIEVDSATVMEHIIDKSYLSEWGYTHFDLLALFIPNTYQVYWTVTPEDLIERLVRENHNFWDRESRLDKANTLGLTKKEVITLASIIERETNRAEEMPTIAGVYLNRLDRGIRLQADPTVIFALGDYTIRRVLKKHLLYDSPFNTYLYDGLPPGPICLPSIASIDAVLNAEDHRYLYFCARPDETGLHAFAETFSAHLSNARKFQQWLNTRNIMR